MAATVLGRPLSGGAVVVVGNAHTPVTPTANGVSMGTWLTRSRPGLRRITIRYGHGGFYNLASRRFPGGLEDGDPARLHMSGGDLVSDLPRPTEAVVLHR